MHETIERVGPPGVRWWAAGAVAVLAAACAAPVRAPRPAPPPVEAVARAPRAAEPPPPAVFEGREVLGAVVVAAGGAPRATIADVLVAGDGSLVGVLLRGTSDGALALVDPFALHPGENGWRLEGTLEETGRKEAELFTDRERTTVQGELVEIQELPGSAGSAELKLHETGPNLLHRVRVDAAELVLRTLPELELGRRVEVEGVLTRDQRGKLLVASALRTGERRLRLRGPEGDLLWDEIGAGVLSLRKLGQARVEDAAGTPVTATGCVIDWGEGSLVSILVDVRGSQRIVDWGHVELDAGTLRLDDYVEALPERPTGFTAPPLRGVGA